VKSGILGGTFNPIHFAHLRLGEAARESLGLECVFFVPAAQPPLKHAGVAPAEDRLEMTRRATAGNPAFQVLDLELRRAGPSYTVDTILELEACFPGTRFWFIMGSDALRELDHWHETERLFELVNLAVASRPGSEAPLEELLPEHFRPLFRRTPDGLAHQSGSELRSIPFAPQQISASEIRRRCARGAPIHDCVPDAVAEYIERRKLYTEAS
jgi:nicotinate-nucleotide adenylyltransferase